MIFLDLKKAYDAFERSKCLEILEGYDMGPRHVGSYGLIGGDWWWWQGWAGIRGRILWGLKE